MDSNWDLKAVLIQVSYDQYKSYRATELQSFETKELSLHPRKASEERASEKQRYEYRTLRPSAGVGE